MCAHGTLAVVPTPEWLWSSRQNPKLGIPIDACINVEIQVAWQQGVRTLGSCCGHGKERPNVVLTNNPEQIEIARRILPNWTLYQWQLIDVSRPGTTYDTIPNEVR